MNTEAAVEVAATDLPAPDAGVCLVPHTHWDREWYEPHDVFRLKLVHVLDEVIARLEDDPAFRFTLDGQTAAIEDYLQLRPENRARVAALVRGGQLAIGPFLILLDEFCCGGETIVRNLELGIAAADRLGGAMEVGYLPDMFGHIAQMPQILHGFGIQHAALWRGVPGVVHEHAFAWSAPDGSAVRCEYLFDGYGSALDMFAVPGKLRELSSQYREQTRVWFGEDPVLGMLGTDHSAPAADLMTRVREHNAGARPNGAPPLTVVTLWEYLSGREGDLTAGLRDVRGELRSHARGNLLPGVFSVRTNLKAAMAEAELALTQAERIDALYSHEDHRPFFDLGWSRVVECSAHDSITGCGVDATADQVAARLASAAHIGRAVTERVAGHLAQAVPSDAHLVINTLPWARTVQADITMTPEPGQVEDAARTQLLGELDTALGDERIASADLEKVLRRIHGRELFGQQIVSHRWGDGRLDFEVAEVPEGAFDPSTLAGEIQAAMSAPDAAEKSWRVVTTARRRSRMLVEVDIPPLGHVAVRPTAPPFAPRSAARSGSRVTASTTRLSNDLLDVVVATDGTLTLTGADGTVLRGVGRLVDEGDRGDSYNYGPLAGGTARDLPDVVRLRVLAAGPIRGVVEVERRYNLPVGLDPTDRNLPIDKTAEFRTRMLVELRADEPFVRLTIDFINTVCDHRLRLHVPVGGRVGESVGAGQFGVVRRGRTAEGGWGEFPLPTFPTTTFVSAGSAHVLVSKLTEYEIVTPEAGTAGELALGRAELTADGGDELALTLLRVVGMMSVNLHPLRDEPAGSEIPVPGAQYLGTSVTTRLAVLPHSGSWEEAEVARWAEIFCHDAVVCRGSGAAGMPLPPPVSGPALHGPAVLTSLRAVHEGPGGGSVVEARLVSVSSDEAQVELDVLRGTRWAITDMRGRPIGSHTELASDQGALPAWSIRTLRSVPGAGSAHPGTAVSQTKEAEE